ncbi:MAG: dihydropteroate synthase [Sphingobacteriales bacterium]|nr:MAG: dihydropteroate synthase [Sphingobacteriales bacterium]
MIPSLNLAGTLLSFDIPKIMGIVNLTPDSFYTKGNNNSVTGALFLAGKLLEEGAHILDLGGQSSRPGAALTGPETEIQRVVPAIEAIIKRFPEALLSVDTFHAPVARAAVEAGARIVNDISAGLMDEKMFQTVSDLKVSYIMMHMKGTPKTMQQNPVYEDIVAEVFDFLNQRVQAARDHGIYDLMLDPGFGFGKTIDQNYSLLKHLKSFALLQLPVLAGLSRKSMIYKVLQSEAEAALNGTTALHMLALNNGAHMLRVHDVKAAAEAISLFRQYQQVV